MPKELTGQSLFDYLLEHDDYDVVIQKFNSLTHREKFEALANVNIRGYMFRATASRGSLTAGDTGQGA